MKSIQFFLAVPLAVAICVSTNFAQETKTKGDSKKDFAKAAKMLHGVWICDTDKTVKEIEKQDLDMEDSMIEMMLERIKTIKMNLTDGEFDVQIGDQEMIGEWEVKKVKRKDKKRVLTVHFAPDDEEGEDKNFEIQLMGKTHMKMVDIDQDGPPIVMKRKTKEEKKDKVKEGKDKEDKKNKPDKDDDQS